MWSKTGLSKLSSWPCKVSSVLCAVAPQVSDFPLGVIFGVCSIFLATAAGELGS